MKSTKLVCAIAIATLGFSSLSFAQNNDWRNARQQPQQDYQQGSRHGNPHDQNQSGRRADDRRDNHDDNRYAQSDMRRNDRGGYYDARGAEFRRGGYIPREFRNRQYVVTDYRAQHLRAPARGQQWVQVGSDYVLVAIATGLIASIILSH